MQRDSWIQASAAAVLCLSLAGSGVLATAITGEAGRKKLTYTQRAEQNDPPAVSLGIAMGAFRGLFVNWLWLRANSLKEAGRYHEAIDLASTITKLQPRSPHVWVFHAWNMAYNISVATNTEVERWNWVRAGIRLLRDEGIPANPNDMLLHKELAYIFIHKVQGWTDDANWYYKRQHAIEWTVIMGEPPKPDPLSRDRAKAIERYVQWLTPTVEAPDSPQEVVRREPLAKTVVDRLREVMESDQPGVVNGLQILEQHAFLSAVRRSGQRAVIEKSLTPEHLKILALIEDTGLEKGWNALLAYLRRRELIERYHMEPDRMLRYTQKYGPIDWRHPGAHALYWATRGVEQGLGLVSDTNKKDFDFVNTDRMVSHALQELWRSGELYFDFLGAVATRQTAPFYAVAPNLHFTDAYGDTIRELRDRSPFDKASKAYSFLSAGYENFLIEALRFYFRRGQYDLANKYYELARDDPYFNLNQPDRPIRFSKTLADFVWDESRDEYTRPDIAREEVIGSLQGAYLQGLLGGDDEVFRRQFEFARQVHEYFFKKQGRATAIDPDMMRMELMSSDFRLVASSELVRLVQVLDLDDAETLYNNAPEFLRRYCYDRVREVFGGFVDQMENQGGRRFREMFPEPPGMDEHRIVMKQAEEAEARRRPSLEQK